jgi:hypothetical protein
MKFLEWFFRRQTSRHSPLEPVQYIGNGTVKLNLQTIQRLEEIANKAAYHREQQEALAVECCELLGCDATGQEIDTDYACEIVYMGSPIGEALDNIITYREMRGKKCQ